MADIHSRLKQANFLEKMVASDFAKAAGRIMGDINYVHPFRDGNGRTQLQFLAQLSERAGHRLDLSRIEAKRWLEASRTSHDGDYGSMAAEIGKCIEE